MTFDELLKIQSIENFDEDRQVEIVGNLFDLSFDNKSIEGVEIAFKLSGQIFQSQLSDENFTLLNYDLSNGWGYLRKLKYKQNEGAWDFQMEELIKEIVHLRTAVASIGFSAIRKERKCQVYTNLGNLFSFIGRFVEAQEYWNKALEILPNFSMAIGNKANGLFYYGLYLFDTGHQNLFLIYSFHYLQEALKLPEYLQGEAEDGFRRLYTYLESKLPAEYLRTLPNLNEYNLGDNPDLKTYREWGIQNKLFINPLNDLGAYTVASYDCLNLPSIVSPAKRAPVYLNLYNQIKQEFGTARFAYYTSIQAQSPHFSDSDIVLIDTMETIRYSYYVEQLKVSFRLSYSILDKIAFLLNDFLKLEIKANQVSFRTLWYSNAQKMILHPFFSKSDNWALRGLFWLSKDLYEKDNDFLSVLEPEAKEIATIRNFIEHKGFKVTSDFMLFPNLYDEESDISYTISRRAFETKTLALLKLTRAAILYLSLAISHEEKKKDYSDWKILSLTPSTIPSYMRL